MISAIFSADGKFLITSCFTICLDSHIYTWDVSTIVEEAGLLLDNVDVTSPPVLKIKGPPRIPPGFFNDALRTRLTQYNVPSNCPNPLLRQRVRSRFPSLWHRSESHRATQRDNPYQYRLLSWTRNLSGILRRRDDSDIQLRGPSYSWKA